jgi:transcriptional regulator with XRE-family HTH domain
MNRLSELRRRHCLSVEAMAAHIKIQPRTLIELECGVRAVEPEAIPLFMQRLVDLGFDPSGDPQKSAA